MLKGTGSISLRRHDSIEKDTRTEFEKMEAGEMFWNSDAKIGEL